MARLPRCQRCDAEMADAGICTACDAALNTPIRLPPLVDRPLRVASPRLGVHVAGRMVDGEQACVLCGDLLAAEFQRKYPEGALIERGRTWQAMKMSGRPTCHLGETAAGARTLTEAQR